VSWWPQKEQQLYSAQVTLHSKQVEAELVRSTLEKEIAALRKELDKVTRTQSLMLVRRSVWPRARPEISD